MATILLVEDNEENRDGLRRRLERRGYRILIAVDGAAGIEMALTEGPDLVLMDMNLPLVDGWEATRRIRASEGGGSLPIIALTAHAMAEDRVKTLQAGCDDYHTKPVEFTRLLQQIEALLQPQGR